MDVPGLSLFQGAESIKLNTSDQQRIEEEDALEDRLRRNEELKNELQNAFDDLADFDDDEDVSLSQTNATIPNNNSRKRPLEPNTPQMFNGNRPKATLPNNNNNELLNEVRHLKNALASKSEELKILSAQTTTERTQLESKINEYKKRLAISEAERERANMSRQQTHELFVESKQKLSARDEQITELNAKIKVLDSRNLELLTELEHTKSMLTDIQHKYHMVERNANFTSEKHTDTIIKQINDRHAAHTDMLQQQINTMRSKLEDRESELKRLMIQNNELHKSREQMLLEKSDTINQLSRSLEDSQRHCQSLVMKTGADSPLVQENLKLMRSIAALEQQNDEMQQTINGLTTRLESTTSELGQLTETAIGDTIANQTNGITETPLIRRAAGNLIKSHSSGFSSSTPMFIEDQLNRMKQEFNRCVADQKLKRQEIMFLKEQLAQKDTEIESLKADENRALIDCTMNKEKAERLANRLKTVERELDQLRGEHHPTEESISNRQLDELRNQLHKLEKENDNFRINCDHLNETVKELEDERDKIEEKYRDACIDIAELQGKLTLIESKPCMDCEKGKFLSKDAQQECIRLKEMYLQVHEEKEEVARKLRQIESLDVNKELLERRSMIVGLERSLQLTEMKCSELTKILDREKIDYEQQIQNLRTRYEQEKSLTESKEQKDCSNSCRKCIDWATKVARFDIENLQLQTTCSSYLKDIHDLKKSLKRAENQITDLTEKLSLKEEHDQLIDDLKSKAKQFEEFMLNQSPNRSKVLDVVSNHRTNRVRDQCVSTEDLLSVELPRSSSSASGASIDRSIEKRIREEMARAMAVKVKAIENQFKDQIHEYQEHLQSLTEELNTLHQTLDERNRDISNLKRCILSERAKIKAVLDEKEEEHNKQLQERQNLLSASRTELENAQKRIEFLTKELDDCGRHFEAERESMNKLMCEWKAELSSFAEREEILTEQMQHMEQEHKITIQNLNEKYVAAKKTAANYKKYSEEKERHIERESERIRSNYESAVRKVKENMESVIKEHEKRATKQIAELKAQIDVMKQSG